MCFLPEQVKYVFATITIGAQALLSSCCARSPQCYRGARSLNNGSRATAVFTALLRAVVRVGQVGVEELHSIAQAVRMIPSQLGVTSSSGLGELQPLLPPLEP